jgi:hypothetical protein
MQTPETSVNAASTSARRQIERRFGAFARVPRFAIFTTLAHRLSVGVDCGFAGKIEQDQSGLAFE